MLLSGYPDIEPRFIRPTALEDASFTTLRGTFLRAARLPAPDPVGTIHLGLGQTKFIESAYALMADLHGLGYTVTVLEREGEGMSARSRVNPQFPSSVAHKVHMADTCHFLTHVAPPEQGGPVISFATCLGGLIALRFLREYPGIFTESHLCAPALGWRDSARPRLLTRFNRHAATMARHGEQYFPGAHDWSWAQKQAAMANPPDTSDLARHMNVHLWQYFHDQLRTGGYTHANVAAVLTSLDVLATPGYAEAITIPVTIHTPTQETIVSIAAQRAMCERLPDADQRIYHGAKHVLWDELPIYRESLLACVDNGRSLMRSMRPIPPRSERRRPAP